jgi:hypothetical protein
MTNKHRGKHCNHSVALVDTHKTMNPRVDLCFYIWHTANKRQPTQTSRTERIPPRTVCRVEFVLWKQCDGAQLITAVCRNFSRAEGPQLSNIASWPAWLAFIVVLQVLSYGIK